MTQIKENNYMEKLNMHTQDVVNVNIEKIGQLFPNCLTERLNENGKPEMAIDFDKLKQELDLKIEEGFGLNSMHIVRIDAHFDIVRARSESAFRSQHIELKEILSGRQKDFVFEGIQGSLICLYYPDYMQGFNAAGWHFHFISEDRKRGGHVFDVKFEQGTARLGIGGQIIPGFLLQLLIQIRNNDDRVSGSFSAFKFPFGNERYGMSGIAEDGNESHKSLVAGAGI